MKVILDENLPEDVKKEIKDIQDAQKILDVNEEHKGILDLELVDKMEDEDVMVTRDKELHQNLLNIGKKSVYYNIEKKNLIETQIKLTYYLKGYDIETVNSVAAENDHVSQEKNSTLRKRFEEVKKENAELKSRVNVLEGKIKSILNTAKSAFPEEED